ncbi:thiol reductant ABC exporter subunit CydC [Amycolatopsis rubida]|uniref:ATP-binding cassette, subfamily C, CydC n=1 Tax=Amycolatopsis rubida TaxID=112413 RepID=A0A1I5XSD2_9PSEU|nr:thiol reductant ABC exporter subunit CydC [Amycolatopsis rubida]SFQ34881.1 ATP-binding cassette, subfamily C, CydC [Amycolatopsis rubida]
MKLVRAALLSVGAELAGLGLTGTAAWLLMRAAEQPPLAALTLAIVAVRVFALARGGLRYAERLAGHDVVLRYLGSLRTRVYQALLPRRVAEHSGADLVTRLVSDVDAVQDAILRLALPAVVAGTVGIAVMIFACLVNLPLAGIILIGLITAGLLLIPRGTAPESRAELAERTVELVLGRDELIAYGWEQREKARAATIIRKLAADSRRTGRRLALTTAAGVAVQFATTTAVALLSPANIPVTAALALTTMALFELVLPLIPAAERIPEIRTSLSRVRAVLSAPEPAPEPVPGPGHFRLTNVGVQHPGRRAALEGIDLDLPPGTRLGVLGPSGAGKTTLLHVLLGFVSPTSGSITVDGRPVAGPHPAVISGALADAHVFATTVRENLLLASPEATDDDLRAACETAGFDLPLDRDTGQDGDALSGGQRQRLLLARAVLAAPPVLVLDEPVEGLDPAHGDEVLARVLAQAKGTVVLVTHRPEHVAGFDQIRTLEDGRLALSVHR